MRTHSVKYMRMAAALIVSAALCASSAFARFDDQTVPPAPPVPATPSVPATPATPAAPSASAVSGSAVGFGSASGSSSVDSVAITTDDSGDSHIVINAVEPDPKSGKRKVVAWLGLGVEETDEALSSQLGLKSGEGLKVSMVAHDSPAQKAEFHKNDVLVDLDGQMLVHPMQLRKLVQMHAEGDSVKIGFYRGGKKQTIEVKLGKTTLEESADLEDVSLPSGLQDMEIKLQGLNGELRGLSGKLSGLNTSLSVDRAKMNSEVKRTMEQTRRAIEDAMRKSNVDKHALSALSHDLSALAKSGVDIDSDATVIVRNKSNRTVVETDKTGSYVIESGEKTHLTARDKHGKLLFEGNIDTPEERKSVPKEVWQVVEPMMDTIRPAHDHGSSSSEGKGSSESKP